ncbi:MULTISPECIES: Rieske 2Fe-2S domain-containing protein [Streptomyces]|uniref:Rieske 2Fe-2S domain-containing protein n=1 Tax=Streptomyces TaxID=1883 RepID=UPI0020794423|nr:Rieske 2Fe-2S domain-containing protein [Streptomyces spororaveus]MCM9080928.1 Rieske 2Fe-2S domain-containing protein [Streptomyces spororaveus]
MTVRSEAGRPGAVRSEGAYAQTVHSGWHLLAFLSELTAEVTPLAIGRRRLVAVRDGDDVRLFDANCPHRGAHLGYGGTLDGNCLVCPFHGKRIALGDEGKRWSVAEHQVVRAGEAVFARLGDTARDDRGFEKVIKEIAVSHPLVEAVVLPVAAPSGLIIENAFDTDHFTALHKVEAVEGMDIVPTENGELAIEGTFPMRNSPWKSDLARAEAKWRAMRNGETRLEYVPRFYARAFSPGLVVTEFGPPGQVHVLVTGATPTPDGCVARVAVGVSPGRESDLRMLIVGSERALAEDLTVWEHLDPHAPVRYDARDEPVIAFREFCEGFEEVN